MDEVAELRAQAKRATEIADDLRYDIQPIARAYMGDLAATVHALLDALAVKDAEVRNELMLSFDILLSAVALIPEHGMREGPTSRGWLACIEELQTRLHGDPPMRVDDLLTLYGEGGELRGREQLPPLPPAERLAAENAALRERLQRIVDKHTMTPTSYCEKYGRFAYEATPSEIAMQALAATQTEPPSAPAPDALPTIEQMSGLIADYYPTVDEQQAPDAGEGA